MNELQFGVIGADRRGCISPEVHRPEDGTRVVAACSLTPERLGILRERWGKDVLLTADCGELLALEELDAVFVCSLDHLHEEHAIAAMEADKDVFLEKPMAISIPGCDRILQCEEETGRKLYVGHNIRFCPVMLTMKRLIEERAIGEVQAIWCRHFISYGGDAYFRDWHSEQRYRNSLLLQEGAHDIDIVHWLAGSTTRAVSGMGKLNLYNNLPRRKPGDP